MTDFSRLTFSLLGNPEQPLLQFVVSYPAVGDISVIPRAQCVLATQSC